MHLNFYLPKYLNGGGELLTTQLIKCIAMENKEITLSLYCQDSKKIPYLPSNILNELHYSRKVLMIIGIFKSNFNNYFKGKCICNISVLSGMIIYTGFINILFRQKLICVEHSNLKFFYFKQGSFFKKKLRILLYNIALLSVEKLIFVSERAMNDSRENIWSINRKKIFVLENPIIDIENKLNLTKLKNITLSHYLIIGRYSPEKRIQEGLEFLIKNEVISQIIVVSKVNNKIIQKFKKYKNIKFYCDYSKVPPMDLHETLLLNFGLVESFSLVIGEWLKAGGYAASSNDSSCNEIWKKYRGFYELDESENFHLIINEIKNLNKQDKRPLFHGRTIHEYKDYFLELIKS